MIDDLERKVGVALRERFPVPSDIDLLSRLERPVARSSRVRVVLAVAACVAAVAALSIVLALRSSTKPNRPEAAAALLGVTWQSAGGTLVFTEDSVRIFDGCDSDMRQATIGDGVLDLGTYFGPSSDCLGRQVVPPDVAEFDRVMASEVQLTWQLTGDTLRLTGEHGATIQLHAAGPALYLTGQDWTLERFVDRGGYEHQGDSSVRLTIDNGTVHATDLCNELTGTATATDTTVTLTDMHSTDHACPDTTVNSLTEIIDQVLSGTITYKIIGHELFLDGQERGELIYTPSR